MIIQYMCILRMAKLYVMTQNHYWIRKCLNRLETKISFEFMYNFEWNFGMGCDRNEGYIKMSGY